MTRIILTIAVLLFNCLTFSQTAKKENYALTIIKGKVIKENKQRFLITPTTLTNNTKETLKKNIEELYKGLLNTGNKKLAN